MRPPPRSTRTDTLFPSPALFRSNHSTFAATATLAGALAVAAVLTTDRAEALAGHACLPQAELLAKQLGTQYGEHLVAAGLDANSGLLQVYRNADSGTWTIAITMPAGTLSILLSG